MPGASRRGVYLSYQRGDADPYARLMKNELTQHLPDVPVFVDVQGQAERTAAIMEAVNSSAVLLALIGRQWAARLDNPDDYVRFEVKTALERGVRVIPVLVDGALPAREAELPADLRKLARLNAATLRDNRYREDADQLLDVIQRVLAAAGEPVEAERATPTEATPAHRAPLSALPLRTQKQDPLELQEQERQELERQEQRLRELERELRERGEQVAAGAAAIRPAAPERPKIFLCYRREDAQGFAGRIYDNLVFKYSREQVFRDIDSTPPGIKFAAWIESRVAQCSVLVAVIGHAWLSAEDRGQRRLDLPDDWVRQEIKAALDRDIPVVPVRLEGAPMPKKHELPDAIADLASFQSAEVTDSRWDYDVGRLTEAIDNLIAPGASE